MTKIIGRAREIRKLTNYAEVEPESKAFFGVKGLGKSTLIESVFSYQNCLHFAEEYHYLYVKTILRADKKGNELANFLLDRAYGAVDLISDDEEKNTIIEKIQKSEQRSHDPESALIDALQIINNYGYTVILVMDDFHNMGRNSDVGQKQYDFLRSLNESKLLYYWIISDSDFSDVYATVQFTTSFFAMKFIPETLPQMTKADSIMLLKNTADKYGVPVNDQDFDEIYSIIGGIPGFVVPSIKCYELLDPGTFSNEAFIESLLENFSVSSMLSVWSRSLTEAQKDLLKEIAERGKVYHYELSSRIGEVNQLGDNSGLGLMIHGRDENGVYWRINSKLYESYILQRTETFYSSEIDKPLSQAVESAPTHVYNQYNYYNISNNFFNPESAYSAIMDIRRLLGSHYIDSSANQKLLTAAIQELPYQQDGWDKIDDSEKDEKMNGFADKVLMADEFQTADLNENQLQRFFLTSEFMESLSDSSRNSLISAIQVFDLLKFCKDKFHLNMINSESARGILFARFYESLLKERLTPALKTIDYTANWQVPTGRVSFPLYKCWPDKLMLGTFATILSEKKARLELDNVCVNELSLKDHNEVWWNSHYQSVNAIKDLRNLCCHSGNAFNERKLDELKTLMFDKHMVVDSLVYDEIANRKR